MSWETLVDLREVPQAPCPQRPSQCPWAASRTVELVAPVVAPDWPSGLAPTAVLLVLVLRLEKPRCKYRGHP